MRKFFTLVLFTAFLFFNFKSYSQCPENDFAIVSGSIVCFNSASAVVTVSGTTAGRTYQAFEGPKFIASPVVSTGGNITIQIPINNDFGEGHHVIGFRSAQTGCPTIYLSDTANVIVNQVPKIDLLVTGDTVCGPPQGSVLIKNSELGVTYVAYIGSVAVSNPFIGTGGDIYIQVVNLQPGNNTIHITAFRKGCSAVNLVNLAVIRLLPYIDIFYSVVGDTICYGQDAKVKVRNSASGLLFEAYVGGVLAGPGIISDGKDFEFLIPSKLISPGISIVTVDPKPKLPKGCAVGGLQQTTQIKANQSPEVTLEIIGDTVSIDDEYAEITIKPAYAGLVYQLMEGTAVLGNVMATSNEVKYKIPVGNDPGKLAVGTHIIVVHLEVNGCNYKVYTDTAIVLVKPSVVLGNRNGFHTSGFNVWPNPMSSELHVELHNRQAESVLVNLMNAFGEKVYEKEFSHSENIVIYPVVPNGVYYLELITDSYKKRVKLVK